MGPKRGDQVMHTYLRTYTWVCSASCTCPQLGSRRHVSVRPEKEAEDERRADALPTQGGGPSLARVAEAGTRARGRGPRIPMLQAGREAIPKSTLSLSLYARWGAPLSPRRLT